MSKFFVRIVVAVLLAFLVVNGEPEVKRFAVITNPTGTMVRSSIEPGANRVGPRNILRGQRLEVLGMEGRLWVKVRTKDGDGFIPLADCEIVEGGLRSSPVGTIILLLVLLGAVGGGAYLFCTKKGIVRREKAEEDDF